MEERGLRLDNWRSQARREHGEIQANQANQVHARGRDKGVKHLRQKTPELNSRARRPNPVTRRCAKWRRRNEVEPNGIQKRLVQSITRKERSKKRS